MSLAGQVAVITGAGRGIGQALALACAREGASVVLAARTADELAETEWLIDEIGAPSLAVVTDVRRVDQIVALAQQAISRFQQVDILVNSAGVGLRAPLADTSERDWDSVVDTLLKGTYFAIQTFVPYLRAQRRGRIVNIAAPLERIATPGFSAYTAAKYGVEGLTHTLAKELRPQGVAVYALHPGGFADTRMVRLAVPELRKGLLAVDIVVEPFLSLVGSNANAETGRIVDARAWHDQQSK